MTKQTNQLQQRADFVVCSAPLAVKDDDDGRSTLVATASSNAIDLEADRFTEPALKQMRDGFKGRLIFMNHSYEVPQDVFGVVEETSLVKREGRTDLDMVIRVETGNPLAVQTYEYVANGTRLGVSVGVIVTEAEKTEDEDAYGNRVVDISGVIPLEASVVGIPANQTAWTQQAVKSLVARGAIEFDEDEVAARPWLTEAVTEKEDEMSKDTTKHEDEDERNVSDTRPDDEDEIEPEDKKDEDSDSDEESDDGGDTEDDEEKEDATTPDEEEEAEEDKEDTVEPDVEKDDFEDGVAADKAADEFIDSMFTGFYVALNNLIPLILDLDIGDDERMEEGYEVIASWTKYVEEEWDNALDTLDSSKEIEDEDIDVDARLHNLISNETKCGVDNVAAIEATAAEIAEAAKAHSEENEQLKAENERLKQAVDFAAQVVDTIMELPLPTVTTQDAAEVAPNLAKNFPNLDTGVVERLARFAPQRYTTDKE